MAVKTRSIKILNFQFTMLQARFRHYFYLDILRCFGCTFVLVLYGNGCRLNVNSFMCSMLDDCFIVCGSG